MNAQAPLFKVSGFDFRPNHLLVIGVLILAFSISMMIRSQNADYGFELNEFDPFYNFRATEYLVENGLAEYFSWHDDMSWHPEGRNISATSQVMQHVTAAATYHAFGGGSSLYDFTIVFPAVFGSLTAVIIFALVRVLGGTAAGLFAALFYSVSIPIITRGTLGWFKSEPLGLFYGLLGLYLFLSGIRSDNRNIALAKAVSSGVFLGFGLASWGGIQFFIIPLGMFILVLPFVRKDFRFLIQIVPVFVASLLITIAMFERPGMGFVLGFGGLSLIVPALCMIGCILVQKISKDGHQRRNALVVLAAVIVLGSSLIAINAESQFLPMPSFRYLNAINPFLTTTNPLTDSVSEHAIPTIEHSFLFHSVLLIFGGLGVWILFSKTGKENFPVSSDMAAFSLIVGLTGVYVSSVFLRLEMFASVSLIILASVGLSVITKEFVSKSDWRRPLRLRIVKASYVSGIVLFLIAPLMVPANANWISVADVPSPILNGGTGFAVVTDDWKDTFAWLESNTPEDSVIAAWWDYGYWITTMSDRKTLADNATMNGTRIANIAKAFLAPPDLAWESLQKMDADYVLIFVAGQKLNIPGESYYILGGGGDESKKQWFMRIAGEPLPRYLHSDGLSGTDHFWQNTLMGNLTPFSVEGYVNMATNQQSRDYVPGYAGIYTKDVKYPAGGDGPFRLAYSSSSFNDDKIGPVIGVFVYEINHGYVPDN